MAASPPPLPQLRNIRLASALNLLLPGCGLFYLGRRMVGSILAAAFLGCFLALLLTFLIGYARYLSIALGGDLLEGNNLEEAGAAFHPHWLVGFTVAGGGLYICSAVLFARARRRLKG